MDFIAFIDNAALLLALSLLSTNIQNRWLKKEPARSILLGGVYGFFTLIVMVNPMTLQPGVIFDGRSVILSLAGFFTGNITTVIAGVIAVIARIVIGGQGVLTGIGSIIISGLAGVLFRRFAARKALRIDLGHLFIFGFCLHFALVLWFFTFPFEIALEIIRYVALPYLLVFPTATMLVGGFMIEAKRRLTIETNLTKSEKHFRDLVETLNEGVWETDRDFVTIFVNPKMAEMLGYQVEEMLGVNFLDFVQQTDHDRIQKLTENRREGVHEQYELELLCKDGSSLFVLMGVRAIMSKDGKFLGALAGVQDITILKQAQARLARQSHLLEEKVEERTRDLREAQEQLLKAEKMAVLGELAGSVGHELRNPLAVIMNAIYLLKSKCIGCVDLSGKEYIAMIEKETQNASHIINDLLDYSRIQPTDKERVTLAELISEILARQSVPDNVLVETQFTDRNVIIKVNSQQLEQILSNLVTNAVEAMPDGGRLTITLDRDKRKAILRVVDSGIGIPQENLKKIFEPMFTTKQHGIGLGLAITKRLAELNNISLNVSSKVGKGTAFTLEFYTLAEMDM